MTQEEKELLLKDLCARLPYGIIASVRGSDEEFQYFHIVGVKDGKVWVENDMLRVNDFDDVEVVKPYLRSMSSMTEGEKTQYRKTQDKISVQWDDYGQSIGYVYASTIKTYDWLNKNHFDYRELIGKGLAVTAPEGMYNF